MVSICFGNAEAFGEFFQRQRAVGLVAKVGENLACVERTRGLTLRVHGQLTAVVDRKLGRLMGFPRVRREDRGLGAHAAKPGMRARSLDRSGVVCGTGPGAQVPNRAACQLEIGAENTIPRPLGTAFSWCNLSSP